MSAYFQSHEVSTHVAPSEQRQAAPGRFGEALRSAAQSVAGTAISTAQVAAPFVPGGAALSAALHGVASPTRLSAAAEASQAVAPPRTQTLPIPTSVPATPASGGMTEMLQEMNKLQAQGQSFNFQYLKLQESMQRDSREFTALSNVMKVKHDSAKSAINNIH